MKSKKKKHKQKRNKLVKVLDDMIADLKHAKETVHKKPDDVPDIMAKAIGPLIKMAVENMILKLKICKTVNEAMAATQDAIDTPGVDDATKKKLDAQLSQLASIAIDTGC